MTLIIGVVSGGYAGRRVRLISVELSGGMGEGVEGDRQGSKLGKKARCTRAPS